MRACKDCTERHTACWSTCEKYKADKQAYDERRAARAAYLKEERVIRSVQYTSLRKAKKDEVKRQKQGRK